MWPVIEALAAFATMISLVVAVLAMISARRQTRELKRVGDSLSTQYRRQFPAFNAEIARLINRAQHRAVLLYDVPAYGILSAPAAAESIIRAVVDAAERGVEVNIVVYGPAERTAIIREQARAPGKSGAPTFSEWLQDPDKLDAITSLLNAAGENILPNEVEIGHLDRFVEASEVKHSGVIESRFREHGVDVDEIEFETQLYFWLIDDTEAIFAFPIFGEGTTEHGFYTRDASLTGPNGALNDIFRNVKKRREAGDGRSSQRTGSTAI